MDQSKAKEGKSSENASESLPPAATNKEKEDGRSASWKSVWIINSLFKSNLRNYNETVRCVIQNEIMNVFLNANKGLYERYHHTHLQPINSPHAHFPSGPSKMYPHSINPPPRTSVTSLSSQNPSPSCSGNTSPSPISQYNNSILPHTFPTESISPSTTSSEENIDTQVSVE